MFESFKKALGLGQREEGKPAENAVEVAQVPAGGRISDKYPGVDKISINLSIKAPFDNIEPTVRGFTLKPDALADFHFRCKNTDCVDGGFNLGAQVGRMVSALDTNAHGRRVCQGWDGKSNIGHQRCYYELNFVIDISYT